MAMEKNTIRNLRTLTIISFLPALAFLLAHSVTQHNAIPALGIIPMSFSMMTGIWQLQGRGMDVCLDIMAVTGLVALLPPVIIYSIRAYGMTVLGIYGSMFMWINLAIHVSFLFSNIRLGGIWKAKHCPHCHCNSRPSSRRVSFAPYDDEYRKERYQAVASDDNEEDEPRTSMSTSILTAGGMTPSLATDTDSSRSVTLV